MDPTASAPPKPLLRGVSHEIAAAFAVAGWVALLQAAPGPRALAAAAVYGLALTAQFAVSALYHRPRWGTRARLVMRRLDHAAIFMLIAGTYTPFGLLLPDGAGRGLLVAVWIGALAGMVLSVAWPLAPKWLMAVLTVGLGWMIVPMLPALHGAIGAGGLWLLGGGGVAYTVGAVVYATRRPDPFPRVFGYHEVFHALVILAAVLHYVAVAGVVGALG
ncbi:MAG: hemolysin III family protein [Anaeromyxobacter sp.]|nr:hemolysin III family protein [Anaeromyxobacter sp.]MBL0275871.1 hemolysin III family protein [Anaeromyxobacter sp.]